MKRLWILKKGKKKLKRNKKILKLIFRRISPFIREMSHDMIWSYFIKSFGFNWTNELKSFFSSLTNGWSGISMISAINWWCNSVWWNNFRNCCKFYIENNRIKIEKCIFMKFFTKLKRNSVEAKNLNFPRKKMKSQKMRKKSLIDIQMENTNLRVQQQHHIRRMVKQP